MMVSLYGGVWSERQIRISEGRSGLAEATEVAARTMTDETKLAC